MSQELAMKTYIQTSDEITPIHSNKEIDRCSYMDNFEVAASADVTTCQRMWLHNIIFYMFLAF